MKTERFEEVIANQIDICHEILNDKAKEYATHDRLHNFKVAAGLKGETIPKALAGMMAKHTISIYDMCNAYPKGDLAVWEEKITGHINYLLLLKAVLLDKGDKGD